MGSNAVMREFATKLSRPGRVATPQTASPMLPMMLSANEVDSLTHATSGITEDLDFWASLEAFLATVCSSLCHAIFSSWANDTDNPLETPETVTTRTQVRRSRRHIWETGSAYGSGDISFTLGRSQIE